MPTEIVARLRETVADASQCGGGGGATQREDERIPVGTTVSVSVSPADVYSTRSTLRMRVADFSGGGIGLLVGETVPIGSDVTIQLPKKDGGTYYLRCSVCNCRSVADGVFRVGVRFEGMEK
jgi:c-di-GMP-binding flagellar brake protein YcgR